MILEHHNTIPAKYDIDEPDNNNNNNFTYKNRKTYINRLGISKIFSK